MDDVFELGADHFRHGDFRVVSFTGSEELSGLYRFDIEVICSSEADFLDGLESKLLGQTATFSFKGPARTYRSTKGYVASVKILGVSRDRRAHVALSLVPKLALLKLNRKSRIFQDKTVREIVDAVLDKWKLKHRFQLVKDYPPRTYVTQYQETDYDFVMRLLATEGMFFFIEHLPSDSASEDVVFIDSAYFYATIADADGAGGTSIAYHDERFQLTENQIREFGLERAMTHEAVLLGDFDFRKPQLAVKASAKAGDTMSSLANALGYKQFQEYLHADRAEYESAPGAHEVDDAKATTALEHLQREMYVGHGASHCRRLCPGRVFGFEGHPIDQLNQAYVVTRVTHKGAVPERAADQEIVYENRFECVPATVNYHVAHAIERPRQVTETAIVVGPSGEEIWRDAYGRIKIQFHWDLDGESDENSSCWVRAAMPWAGGGWGVEFTPRVGMEVLVSFLGGDVDRPVVVGGLYNGTHPTPWHGPDEKTKSGIRTQTVGGEGYNEVSFEDARGKEALIMHAQRDFLTTTRNDHAIDVGRDLTLTVKGKQTQSIGGGSSVMVGGDASQTISSNQLISVLGDALHAVSGNSDTRVSGLLTARVEGDEKREVFASSELAVREDRTVRVTGHMMTIVGQHDDRRSSVLHVEGQSSMYSAGATEITSDKRITLRCGKTSIIMSDDTIEISAPNILVKGDHVETRAEEKVRVISKKEQLYQGEKIRMRVDKVLSFKAEKSQIALEKIVKIDGDLVKMNCGPDPIDELVIDEKPLELTKFHLEDEDGKPIPNRRYVLVFADGTEQSGFLDENGKAEVYLEEGGEIMFPDVDGPRQE